MTTHRELSDRLGMSREEGERWIVDLVRDARLDAKIDFKEVGLLSPLAHNLKPHAHSLLHYRTLFR